MTNTSSPHETGHARPKRISPTGWTAIVCISVAVLLTLSVLAEVTNGVDAAIVRFAADNRSEILTTFFSAATLLGGMRWLTILVGAAAALLIIREQYRPAIALAAGTALVFAIEHSIKWFVSRPRPAIEPIGVEKTFAFPSGHAMMSAFVYLLVAFLIMRYLPKGMIRRAAIVVLFTLPFVVGISRVYLGVHWPTDVLGGWLLGGGLAAAAVCLAEAGESQGSSA